MYFNEGHHLKEPL